jgi:hypothetical protein
MEPPIDFQFAEVDLVLYNFVCGFDQSTINSKHISAMLEFPIGVNFLAIQGR